MKKLKENLNRSFVYYILTLLVLFLVIDRPKLAPRQISMRNHLYIGSGEENANEGILLFDHIRWLHPENPNAWAVVGALYYQKGNYKKAEMMLIEALNMNPDSDLYRFLLAHTYLKRDKTSEANALLQSLQKTQFDVTGLGIKPETLDRILKSE